MSASIFDGLTGSLIMTLQLRFHIENLNLSCVRFSKVVSKIVSCLFHSKVVVLDVVFYFAYTVAKF